MSKSLLALEVHGNRAVLASVSPQGDGLRLEHVLRVEAEDAKPASLGSLLAAEMTKHKVHRGEVLISLSRSQVESRVVSLPPAPDEELPSMVRFVCGQELPNIREDWLLDFLPLDDDASAARRVLVVAIDPAVLASVSAVATAAGLRPKLTSLRTLGLLAYHGQSAARIVVALAGQDLDVLFALRGRPEILRTTKLPAAAAQSRFIVAEVKRTLAAIRNRGGGLEVGQAEVLIVPGEDMPDGLADQLGMACDLPCEVIEPAEAIGLSRGSSLEAHGDLGLSGMLGLLAMAAREERLAIDLLAPRQPPKPPSRARPAALAVGAAIALVIFLGVMAWQQLSSLDAEIARLQGELDSSKSRVSRWSDIVQRSAEVQDWTSEEIVWLDELQRLAQGLPEPQKVMITQLAASATADGGRVQLDGVASQSGVVAELERGLRSDRIQVSTSGGQDVPTADRYRWRFQSTLVVSPEVPEDTETPRATEDVARRETP